MPLRRGFGSTDIARQNAEVFLTAARWALRLFAPVLLVSFLATTVLGLHASGVATPLAWLRHLGSGDAATSLGHLAATMALLLLGVALETLLVCRAVFARGEAPAIAEVRKTARRLLERVRRAVDLATAAAPRPAPSPDLAVGDGILHQLCRALVLSPAAPPPLPALVRARAVHARHQLIRRTEVATAS